MSLFRRAHVVVGVTKVVYAPRLSAKGVLWGCLVDRPAAVVTFLRDHNLADKPAPEEAIITGYAMMGCDYSKLVGVGPLSATAAIAAWTGLNPVGLGGVIAAAFPSRQLPPLLLRLHVSGVALGILCFLHHPVVTREGVVVPYIDVATYAGGSDGCLCSCLAPALFAHLRELAIAPQLRGTVPPMYSHVGCCTLSPTDVLQLRTGIPSAAVAGSASSGSSGILGDPCDALDISALFGWTSWADAHGQLPGMSLGQVGLFVEASLRRMAAPFAHDAVYRMIAEAIERMDSRTPVHFSYVDDRDVCVLMGLIPQSQDRAPYKAFAAVRVDRSADGVVVSDILEARCACIIRACACCRHIVALLGHLVVNTLRVGNGSTTSLPCGWKRPSGESAPGVVGVSQLRPRHVRCASEFCFAL